MDVRISNNSEKWSIDLGLHFARSRLKQFLLLSAIPILFRVFAVSWQFGTSFADKEVFFLTEIIIQLSDAWLVAASAMFVLSVMRSENSSVKSLLLRALQYLPKVFLSYLVFQIVVSSVIYMAPLLLFVVFFVWAPYFCIGETFIPESRKSTLEDDYEPDSNNALEVLWFARKSVLDLGFARSVHLVGTNISSTLQVVLLIWFFSMVPRAIISLISPVHYGLGTLLLEVVTLGVVTAFVSAATTVVFVSCLSVEAREEISIPSDWEWKLLKDRKVKFGFQGRPIAMVIIVALSFLATYHWNNALRASYRPPESLTSSIESVSSINNRLRVVLRLGDADASFRWFNYATTWQLKLESIEFAQVNPVSNQPKVIPVKVEKTSTTNSVGSEPLKVAQVKVKNQTGAEQTISSFRDFGESLTLVLYFDIPAANNKSFARLEHLSHFGDTTNMGRVTFPLVDK